jgi:NitT/TauT family transport system substrate-binding protein
MLATMLSRVGGLLLIAALVTMGPAAGQSPPTLTVACSSADAFAQAIYAQGAGFFTAAGLTVRLVNLQNSGAIASAVAGGSIDIGLANPIAIANAHEQGLPFEIIAPSALYRADKPTTLLVVPNASPQRTAKDLEGKTIAVIEVRGIMEASIRSWMTQSGADPANVHFIEMPFPAMGPALMQGRVDAAFIAEPFLASVRESVREIGNPYSALAKVWYSNIWFAKGDWLAANATTAHRFVSAIEKAADWANTHQPQTAAMLLSYAKTRKALGPRVTRTFFADSLELADIEPVLNTAVKFGAIKEPITAAALIAPGF